MCRRAAPPTFCPDLLSPEEDEEEGGKEPSPFFSSISSPARVGLELLSAYKAWLRGWAPPWAPGPPLA